MTTVIDRLADLRPRYGAVFCDLWGVVHDGVAAFPAAVAALRDWRVSGGRVILVTNAPRPREAVAAGFARLGVPRDAWDDMATSGDAAQAAMLSGAVGARVFHWGPAKDDGFFTAVAADLAALGPGVTRVPLAEAEGIVCTGPVDELTETPDDWRPRLLAAKARGLPMLCANPDVEVDLGDRRIWCAGAIARDYAAMGGEVLYFGKPHPPIYDLARRRLAALDPAAEAEILAIGDGVDTDLRGGVAEGLDVLFVTDGLAAGSFGPDPERPDPGAVQVWLAERQLTIPFAIGRLR